MHEYIARETLTRVKLRTLRAWGDNQQVCQKHHLQHNHRMNKQYKATKGIQRQIKWETLEENSMKEKTNDMAQLKVFSWCIHMERDKENSKEAFLSHRGQYC